MEVMSGSDIEDDIDSDCAGGLIVNNDGRGNNTQMEGKTDSRMDR